MPDRDQSALKPTRSTPEPDDESPGVPGFRSWAGVYWFVLAVFVALVALLTVFSRVYA